MFGHIQCPVYSTLVEQASLDVVSFCVSLLCIYGIQSVHFLGLSLFYVLVLAMNEGVDTGIQR